MYWDWLLYADEDVSEGKHISQWRGTAHRTDRAQSAVGWKQVTGTSPRQRTVASYNNRAKFDTLLKGWKQELKHIVELYFGGEYSATAVEPLIRKKLHDIHAEAYRLGKRSAEGSGGLWVTGNTPSDDKHVKSIVRHEYMFLRKLLDDMHTAKQRLGDQSGNGAWAGPGMRSWLRIQNYAEAAKATFNSGRIAHLPDDVILYWVVSRVENCPDCLMLQSLSPYTPATLPTTPGAGASRCLHNCKCRIMVKQATPDKVRDVARRNRSPAYILRLLREARDKKR